MIKTSPYTSLYTAQNVIDTSSEAFILVDKVFKIHGFNDSAAAVFGDELQMGDNLKDYVPFTEELSPQENNSLNIQPVMVSQNGRLAQVTTKPLDDEYYLVKITPKTDNPLNELMDRYEINLDLILAVFNLLRSRYENIDHFIDVFIKEIGASGISVYQLKENNDKYQLIESFSQPDEIWNTEFPAAWIDDLPIIWKASESDIAHPGVIAESKSHFPLVITSKFSDPEIEDSHLLISAFDSSGISKTNLNNYWILHNLFYKMVNFENGEIKDKVAALEPTRQTNSLNENNIIRIFKDGMMIINQDLEVIDINPAAKKILGYENINLMNQKVDQVIVGSPEIQKIIELALDGNATEDEMTRVMYRRDGRAVSVSIQAIPVPAELDSRNVLFIFRDMTEYEQYLEITSKLEQKALLGEYMSVFSHEVMNPINNLISGLEVLQKFDTDGRNADRIDRLIKDSGRIVDLAKSTLNQAREIQLPQMNTTERFDIKLLLENVLAKWSWRLQNHRIKQVNIFDVDHAFIKGDYRTLERAFNNIISNAFEAMKQTSDDKVLTVKLCTSSSEIIHKPVIQIDFSDTGPGIPEEIRDKIFEPYFTASKGGTGLGLPITKQIITAHQGNIKVISIPGATVVRIQLPQYNEGI